MNASPVSMPTASAACAGLVPAGGGRGVEHADDVSEIPFCDVPITDGRGEWIGVGFGLHWLSYRFVRSADPEAETGGVGVPLSDLATYGGSPVLPQPDGYHVIRAGTFPGTVLRFDARGEALADGQTLGRVWYGRPRPGGGSVVFTVEPAGAHYVSRLEWLDGSGTSRASVIVDEEQAFEVSVSGRVLAVGSARARWFGADGRLLDEAPLPPGIVDLSIGRSSLTLSALADGSVVLARAGVWVSRFHEGVAAAEPVPEWLAVRPGTRVYVVRGGAANAVVAARGCYRGACTACRPSVEILTPAGELCGSVQLNAPRCDDVVVGTEGTLMLLRSFPVPPDRQRCTWDWWSGLLR